MRTLFLNNLFQEPAPVVEDSTTPAPADAPAASEPAPAAEESQAPPAPAADTASAPLAAEATPAAAAPPPAAPAPAVQSHSIGSMPAAPASHYAPPVAGVRGRVPPGGHSSGPFW